MNFVGYLNWRAVITEHHGELKNFKDFSTVEFMLNEVNRTIKEFEDILETVPAEAREEYKGFFQKEIDIGATAKAELEEWFTQRETLNSQPKP